MKKLEFKEIASGFRVLEGTKKSQCATMVLKAGDSTGGPDNKHENSDQWLYVLSGIGEAIVNDKKTELSKGNLIMIEAGETHEIKKTGDADLETLNIYAPPAY